MSGPCLDYQKLRKVAEEEHSLYCDWEWQNEDWFRCERFVAGVGSAVSLFSRDRGEKRPKNPIYVACLLASKRE